MPRSGLQAASQRASACAAPRFDLPLAVNPLSKRFQLLVADSTRGMGLANQTFETN
jgi:hypothetical protein